MGFFDKALKKVQDVGENIAASANNVKTVVETSVQDTMEITGLKRQIRELEKEMDAQYLQIGKKYAEFVADMDDAEPETAENEAAEATESSEVIDEVKAEAAAEAIDEVKAEAADETVDEAKEEAAAETIDEVKAEDTAETIDEEKEASEEPAEDKVAEESDEDEEPVFDVSDFLTIIKQDQAKKKELENQLAEVEKRAKQNTLLREKTKAEESFEQEKGVLDKALAMEIISKEEYEQKLNIARKKVENFEEIKKIEQQFEMGIITKEEKDEKINAILNA
mgnify:CR=1 FL=1